MALGPCGTFASSVTLGLLLELPSPMSLQGGLRIGGLVMAGPTQPLADIGEGANKGGKTVPRPSPSAGVKQRVVSVKVNQRME